MHFILHQLIVYSTIDLQGHCGFPSFPVVDWFCLFVDLWVLPFCLEDCSVFGNFVITLIYTINGKTIDRKIKYFFPKFLFFAIQQYSVFTLFMNPSVGKVIKYIVFILWTTFHSWRTIFCGFRKWTTNLRATTKYNIFIPLTRTWR